MTDLTEMQRTVLHQVGAEGAESVREALWVSAKPRDEITSSPAADVTSDRGNSWDTTASIQVLVFLPSSGERWKEEGRKSSGPGLSLNTEKLLEMRFF